MAIALSARPLAPLAASVAAALFFASAPARADVIFGCWSHEGETIEISASGVVTPGGASPEAAIDLHGAAYIAPEGERDAGRRLVFRMLNEELVTRRVDLGAEQTAANFVVEYWTPCSVMPMS